ncbi:MAG TPA: hypothetical protein VIT92_06595 [Burkholderiaceae bacterium]
MKALKGLLAAVLAVSVATAALAAPDPAKYQLTPATMKKLDALQKDEELKKKFEKDDDDDDNKPSKNKKDDQSVDGMIRKLDATPGAKAALAKHGLTTTEFAVAMAAMMHAGFYVMFESAMDKKKAAEMYKTYTKEQQANIAMVRTLNSEKKK